MEVDDITKMAHHQKVPTIMLRALFLVLCILLHLLRNLLNKDLLWTFYKLSLHLMFLLSKQTDEFRTVTYKKKTTIGDPAVNSVEHHTQLLTVIHNSPFLPVIST